MYQLFDDTLIFLLDVELYDREITGQGMFISL